MFEDLTTRLNDVLRQVRGQAHLSEDNIQESLTQVRRALLEADVNIKVARDFVERVRTKVVGEKVLRGVHPGQQLVKIVHEEIVGLLGGETSELHLKGESPAVILVAGLQGSGKTTFCAKLAKHLVKKKRRPLLIAADVYRPAAIDQLQILGAKIDVPVFTLPDEKNVPKIVEAGQRQAREKLCDVVIIDTAGRTHIDETLMEELEAIREAAPPKETLLVLDAMTGQEAVNVAVEFDRRIAVTGVVLTKMDGDARGGAALSLRTVLGKPIKFVGVGEALEDLELFHPDRMAQRILGMGDVVTLVEKASEVIDEEQARLLEEKVRKQTLTLDDFLGQLQAIRKMGSLDKLVGMIPGVPANALSQAQVDPKQLDRVQGIVHSMTRQERQHPRIIDGSRRRRIAKGSGTSVQEVNQLLAQFSQMKKLMRSMIGASPRKAARVATTTVAAGRGRMRFGSKRKRRKN